MKKLISLIVLFVIAAIVLTLIQYFQTRGETPARVMGPTIIPTNTAQ